MAEMLPISRKREASRSVRCALAQINPTVGDAPGNADRILVRLREAREAGAALMATPELALCGYPPEDLLFHRGFRRRIDEAMARLAEAARGIDLLVGYPEYSGGELFNSAAWIRDGRRIANYRKQRLPNYQVFDEKRYSRRAGTRSWSSSAASVWRRSCARTCGTSNPRPAPVLPVRRSRSR